MKFSAGSSPLIRTRSSACGCGRRSRGRRPRRAGTARGRGRCPPRRRVLDLQARVDLEEGDRAVGGDEVLAGSRAEVADLLEDRLRASRRTRSCSAVRKGAGPPRRASGGGAAASSRASRSRRRCRARRRGTGSRRGGGGRGTSPRSTRRGRRRRRPRGSRTRTARDLAALAGDLSATAAAVGGLDRDGSPTSSAKATTSSAEATGSRVPGPGAPRPSRRCGGRRPCRRGRGSRRGRGRFRPAPRVDDRLCEVGVLREEAVPRVDGVGARAARDAEQLLDDEVVSALVCPSSA